MNKIYTVITLVLLAPCLLISQNTTKEQVGIDFVQKNLDQLGLTKADISDMVITDMYQTKHNGVTHIYFGQTYDGIQVDKALINMNISAEGEVLHHGNRFVPDFESRIESSENNVGPIEAVVAVAENLEFEGFEAPTLPKKDIRDRYVFERNEFTSSKTLAQEKFFKTEIGTYRRGWEVFLMETRSPDSWYVYVDGETGDVLHKIQNTLYCSAHPGMYHNHSASCRKHNKQAYIAPAVVDGAQYRVLPLPAESPTFGDFELIENPCFEQASPYGWHDVDGMPGPEYTITRGNNVWSYEDADADDFSLGNEPDGGPNLVFDFPYDPNLQPFDNMEADVTGLFYMNNMMHDLSYLVGFDEAAGAFQNNNYGNGGQGNDEVFAHALDGSGTNNANFATPPDGLNGQMQMFRWEISTGLFRVLEPLDVAQEYTTSYAGGGTGWALMPLIEDVDVTGEMVVVQDGDPQNPQNGCGELINDVNGKIAVIFRGLCEFGTKTLNAQNAGAVAAVICNVPGVNGGDGETAMGMAGGQDGDNVTIPLISLAFSDCNRIVAKMDDGPVIGQLKLEDITGPTEVSSGFDNGVIAHEYGHGISNRLIGGPNNAGCMTNDEQVGEGISDYFALVTTVEPGDQGSDARGIGNFVDGLGPDGRGIRRFPYSTDMSICPLTYDDIKGTTAPHPLGEVWTACLWDVYWAFVDLYGWNPDWEDTTSGNFRAVQLAIDGMKAAPCSAGFIDMRDALMAADGGEHECLLWEIFARRGLGYFTEGGDPNNREDGTENFESLPTCITTLKIRKTVPELISAGDEVPVTIDVINHTLDTTYNTIVTDNIQDGLIYRDGSANVPVTVNGNQLVFELGDLETLAERTITYVLESDPDYASLTNYINTVETSDEQDVWVRDFGGGFNFWDLSQFDAYSGSTSWLVSEIDGESRQMLLTEPHVIQGSRPVFRAYHRINSTQGTNGGFIEISTDRVIWRNVDDMIIQGDYFGPLSYTNFAIPFLEGFTGSTQTGDFTATYVDVSDYAGQEVTMRFIFGTYDPDENNNTTFDIDAGWFVDDVEMMDLRTYEVEAIVSADNADDVVTGVQEIIVDSDGIVNTDDIELEGVDVRIFPNPAGEMVTIKINSESAFRSQINLYSVDGRLMDSQISEVVAGPNFTELAVADYAPGFYFIQIRDGERFTTKKLIIE